MQRYTMIERLRPRLTLQKCIQPYDEVSLTHIGVLCLVSEPNSFVNKLPAASDILHITR